MVSIYIFIAVLTLASSTFANPTFDSEEVQFKDFIRTYNRHYDSVEEYQKRFEIFKENLKRIKYLQESQRGKARFGITKFADKSKKEMFPKAFTPEELTDSRLKTAPTLELSKPPTNFDWRDYNVVTRVKNEETCLADWIFSAVGNIEGQYAIKYNNSVSLSSQEVLNCQKKLSGCHNLEGKPSDVYFEVKNVGGLVTDQDCPYLGFVEKCDVDPSEIVVQVSDGLQLTKNEDKLVDWLYANGPISAVMNGDDLVFYFDGIYEPDDDECDGSLDLGVLLVGYGEEYGDPYWIIKNSWGADWGEEGYFRLYRGLNFCGINAAATTSVIV